LTSDLVPKRRIKVVQTFDLVLKRRIIEGWREHLDPFRFDLVPKRRIKVAQTFDLIPKRRGLDPSRLDLVPKRRGFEPSRVDLDAMSRKFSSPAAHIDLAGDGGGDQRGPAFLQQVDEAQRNPWNQRQTQRPGGTGEITPRAQSLRLSRPAGAQRRGAKCPGIPLRCIPG
jgi:hypothetical protein